MVDPFTTLYSLAVMDPEKCHSKSVLEVVPVYMPTILAKVQALSHTALQSKTRQNNVTTLQHSIQLYPCSGTKYSAISHHTSEHGSSAQT